MREILGKAKTIKELLSGVKYSIDYYQREYKWGRKQIQELIDDLSNKFLEDYHPNHSREIVENYGHYFLGSIIISRKNGQNYIVDGQQRLTTLTLLLIYLNNLKRQHPGRVKNIDELIFSEKYGRKSYNLEVDERRACMDSLYEQQLFTQTEPIESVQNMLARYEDIVNYFPEELRDDVLPFFVDWLIENVHMVEITAYSDDDAYFIFETMNDRGLSLSPIDMLKSYLLANILDEKQRNSVNTLWKDRILDMNKVDKDIASDFFKTWLRSQYANKIRERKKDAEPEDFDRIGAEFHRWIRDERENIGLQNSSDFYNFINRDFNFYSIQYIRLMIASTILQPSLEHILYNTHHGFTLQYNLLLSPLNPHDSEQEIVLKLRLVAMFIDILITWRLWNLRSIAYSTMQYAMFLVMRNIRGLDSKSLAEKLYDTLNRERETFTTEDRLYVHQQNRKYIHRILARITDYIEQQSGLPSRYMEYVSGQGSSRYEIEHIWADKPELHTDEFSHAYDFQNYRNRIGGLLLLPKSFNASYGDLEYKKKVPHYNKENLLARSLHPLCYDHNPGFFRFIEKSGLPFRPHNEFNKVELDERQELVRMMAKHIWHPNNLMLEIKK